MKTKKVTLPSGLEVELKAPGLIGMRDLLAAGLTNETDDPVEQFDRSLALVEATTVNPRYSRDPGEGESNLDDIPAADLEALLGAVNEVMEGATPDPLSSGTGS